MIIKVEKLTKQYRHKDGLIDALSNISFAVEKGSFVTITGPSGSGKSTLLLSLFGLIKPTSGKIFFNDAEISNATDNELAEIRQKHVGFIMQNFALIPYLTTIHNIMVPLTLEKIKKNEQWERAMEVLKFIGLENRVNHLPRELSTGQQQRVAIARALVHHPSVILADEPTGNLDPALSLEILDFLKKINQTKGITVIMVTHSPVAAGYGNLKIHLSDGHLSEQKVRESVLVS
ncbi:MAG: ABC transporter ATP-binding protein [Lentimicrobiaceae bacterium]|nr:ABC transporter ATP-binding protein [Lentimicrobiaceae bacterium]